MKPHFKILIFLLILEKIDPIFLLLVKYFYYRVYNGKIIRSTLSILPGMLILRLKSNGPLGFWMEPSSSFVRLVVSSRSQSLSTDS